MGVGTRNIDKASAVGLEFVQLPLGTTAVSQTATLAYAFKPGYAFTVASVQVYAAAVTATATVDVQIGTTSVLTGQITPVAATVVAGTLSSTKANIVGGAADTISLKYTTNGTGAVTAGTVTVAIRPSGMEGDLQIKG